MSAPAKQPVDDYVAKRIAKEREGCLKLARSAHLNEEETAALLNIDRTLRRRREEPDPTAPPAHVDELPDEPPADGGDGRGLPREMTAAQLAEQKAAAREQADVARETKKRERDDMAAIMEENRQAALLEKIPAGVTLTQLLATDYPEPKWAADGLIPEGLTILGGPPKMGKSWLTLGLALAVSCGGRFLGTIPVQQRRVLLLALEDSERRLADRLKQLHAEPNEDLVVRTRWEWGLSGLKAEVERSGADLVIVDTLQRWRGYDGEQDSYAKDYDAVGELQTYAIDNGINLVANHHTRKAVHDDPLATVSGTYGITGAADTILVLRRAQGFEGAELVVRGRDVEPQEIALRFEESVGWAMIGDANIVRLSDERQAILELLRDAGEPLGPTAIAKELGIIDTGMKMMLRRMVRDGELARVKRGQYALPEKRVTSVT